MGKAEQLSNCINKAVKLFYIETINNFQNGLCWAYNGLLITLILYKLSGKIITKVDVYIKYFPYALHNPPC